MIHNHTEQEELFSHLKELKDYYVLTAVEALEENADLIWSDCEKDYLQLREVLNKENKEAYKNIINELLKTMIHSILVMIDGGDCLNEKYALDLIIKDKNISLLVEGSLNEGFIDYIVDVEEELGN